MTDFIVFTIIGLIILMIVSLALGFVILLDRAGCYAGYAQSGYKIRYKVMGGCQINYNGNWIPVENWRAV